MAVTAIPAVTVAIRDDRELTWIKRYRFAALMLRMEKQSTDDGINGLRDTRAEA